MVFSAGKLLCKPGKSLLVRKRLSSFAAPATCSYSRLTLTRESRLPEPRLEMEVTSLRFCLQLEGPAERSLWPVMSVRRAAPLHSPPAGGGRWSVLWEASMKRSVRSVGPGPGDILNNYRWCGPAVTDSSVSPRKGLDKLHPPMINYGALSRALLFPPLQLAAPVKPVARITPHTQEMSFRCPIQGPLGPADVARHVSL